MMKPGTRARWNISKDVDLADHAAIRQDLEREKVRERMRRHSTHPSFSPGTLEPAQPAPTVEDSLIERRRRLRRPTAGPSGSLHVRETALPQPVVPPVKVDVPSSTRHGESKRPANLRLGANKTSYGSGKSPAPSPKPKVSSKLSNLKTQTGPRQLYVGIVSPTSKPKGWSKGLTTPKSTLSTKSTMLHEDSASPRLAAQVSASPNKGRQRMDSGLSHPQDYTQQKVRLSKQELHSLRRSLTSSWETNEEQISGPLLQRVKNMNAGKQRMLIKMLDHLEYAENPVLDFGILNEAGSPMPISEEPKRNNRYSELDDSDDIGRTYYSSVDTSINTDHNNTSIQSMGSEATILEESPIRTPPPREHHPNILIEALKKTHPEFQSGFEDFDDGGTVPFPSAGEYLSQGRLALQDDALKPKEGNATQINHTQPVYYELPEAGVSRQRPRSIYPSNEELHRVSTSQSRAGGLAENSMQSPKKPSVSMSPRKSSSSSSSSSTTPVAGGLSPLIAQRVALMHESPLPVDIPMPPASESGETPKLDRRSSRGFPDHQSEFPMSRSFTDICAEEGIHVKGTTPRNRHGDHSPLAGSSSPVHELSPRAHTTIPIGSNSPPRAGETLRDTAKSWDSLSHFSINQPQGLLSTLWQEPPQQYLKMRGVPSIKQHQHQQQQSTASDRHFRFKNLATSSSFASLSHSGVAEPPQEVIVEPILAVRSYSEAHVKIPRNTLDKFRIPTQPSGRNLTFNILSNWGDPHYFGMNAIEIFGMDGALISDPSENKAIRIRGDPDSINVLPEYENDTRDSTNLVDGNCAICNDVSVWLAPFSEEKAHYLYIDLGSNFTLSMIRIWNYNKSRINSFRGVRYIQIHLDDQLIFQGEIQKAPGHLDNLRFAECILFTPCEGVRNLIQAHDAQKREGAYLDERWMMARSMGASGRPRTQKGIQSMMTPIAPKTYQMGQSIQECDSHPKGEAPYLSVPRDNQPSTGERPLTAVREPVRKTSLTDSVVTTPGASPHISEHSIPKGKHLYIYILSTWGDPHHAGLSCLEILDQFQQPLEIIPSMISSNTETDATSIGKLIDGSGASVDPDSMWLVPFQRDRPPCIQIAFGREVKVSGVRFWNYNSSLEWSIRGVRKVRIVMDKSVVSPDEGFVIKKAPGNANAEAHTALITNKHQQPTGHSVINGQAGLNFGLSVGATSMKSALHRVRKASTSSLLASSKPALPTASVYRIDMSTTHGDLTFVGLNGICFYGSDHKPITLTMSNLQAMPRDLAILDDHKKDVRTLDKLIDGHNQSDQNDFHAWLTPYTLGCQNRLYIVFEEPVPISLIQLWNYQKTPSCGAKDITVFADDSCIFKGTLARGAPNSENRPQSIMFSKDHEFIAKHSLTLLLSQKPPTLTKGGSSKDSLLLNRST